jgi:hypothetical protein
LHQPKGTTVPVAQIMLCCSQQAPLCNRVASEPEHIIGLVVLGERGLSAWPKIREDRRGGSAAVACGCNSHTPPGRPGTGPRRRTLWTV